MSNRIHSSRLDFRSGWVMLQQRYGVPGAPAEMNNVQLDLMAEGAVRPTWGMVPFAFIGDAYTSASTDSQWTFSTSGPKYTGISGIEVLKVGDGGTADTVMLTVDKQAPAQSTYSTAFYYLTAPTTVSKKMNFPFGTSFTASCNPSTTLSWQIADLVYLHGQPRPKHASSKQIPITVAKTAGGGTLTQTYNYFEWFAPASTGSNTLTVTFTHDETTVVETLTIVVDVTDENTPNNHYHIFTPNPVDWTTPISTSSVYNAFQFQTPVKSSHNEVYITSPSLTSNLGDYIEYSQGDTYSFLNPEWSLTSVPPHVWELAGTASYFQTQENYQETPAGAVTLGGTTTIYFYYPCNAPISDTASANQWSTAMVPVNTITGLTPSTTGPLGYWKAASMNGKAFWFCGYSGTSFWVDLDDPTTTGSIGLTKPDCSATTLSTYSDPQKYKNAWPRRRVRYWFSEIDEEGYESALADQNYSIDNEKYEDTGVRISNIPAPSNSLSYIRIYRSFSKLPSPRAGEPYWLADQEPTNPATTSIYLDRTPDDELGDPPWTHGDLPPYDAFCPVVYYDRLWVLGTRPGVTGATRTTLFWSDINEPQSFWWDGNWANVYGDDGDEVTALVRDKTGLLVFKNNHLYLMSGRTPEEISFNEITVEDSDTGVGCPHPNAVIATDFGVFFYWNRAIYRYLQGQVVKVSRQISPMLEGYDELLPTGLDIQWPYYGVPDEYSVTLSYDPVTQVVYVGMNGLFPNVEDMPESYFTFVNPYLTYDPAPNSLNSMGRTNEVTLMLDVANQRWVGMYTFNFGFFRRIKTTLYSKWNNITSNPAANTSNGLICAYAGTNDSFLGFSARHPLLVAAGTSLMNTVPIWHSIKFRPVSGNLGPYSSKRFIAVDYLMDDDGAVYNSAASGVQSKVFLDGSTTVASTATLAVQGGAIYADRIRHTLGLVGSEVEAQIWFDPDRLGGVTRLFEYGVAWQNLGRETAEHPGAAPSTPKGGPALTGPPVKLG